MSKKFTLFTLFVTLVMLVSACTPAAAPTTAPQPAEPTKAPEVSAPTTAPEAPKATEAPTNKEPVVFRVGITDVIQTTNPLISGLLIEDRMFQLFYSTLVMYDLDGNYRPVLAEKVTNSEDGLTWTYAIHKDAKFSDGTPLTAKDAVFSINMLINNPDIRLHKVTENFDKAEATDDYTVVIHMKKAIPNMNDMVAQIWILPEHIWGQLEKDKKLADYPNNEIIGSGPFVLKEFKKGEYLDMTVNKDYFEGAAKYDELVWQYYNNNDAAVQALISGEVDMLEGAPNTALGTLKKTKDIQVIVGPNTFPSVTDIILNQIKKDVCPKEKGICNHHPALFDVNVRKAMSMATDKQKIIDAVMLGNATPGVTLVPRGLGKWFNSDIKDLPFDIAGANKILDDAGYKDVNKDGVREMPDGTNPLNFRLYFPTDYSAAPRIAELLNETWSQIGIKLEIKGLDSDALGAAVNPGFDFEVAIWGWGSNPDPANMLSVYITDSINTGRQEIGYSNKEYDDLYVKQGQTIDPEERRKIVWQMQQMLFDDFGYIIPYYASSNMVFRTDKFKGWPTDKPLILSLSMDNMLKVEPIQ